MTKRFDIIVVGGGHAGVEAAWAAASMGASVALVTMQREAIGRMSCNPAIGGLGKGQMVREIDALGGLMGLATDRAGIQFRMLNRSKGPAVWAPRAQADREGYPKAVQELLGRARNIEIIEGSVEGLDVKRDSDGATQDGMRQGRRGGEGAEGGGTGDARPYPAARVCGVTLGDGRRFAADAVILTTGTFLRGLMHCGEAQTGGGRIGEAAAVGVSAALLSLGFELGRLKTGTPPRIHRDTIDYDACEPQPGDERPTPFSAMTDAITQQQVNCWVTWTNANVHDHIRANLHRAPMYSGQIQSTGPRYCPSIEDKVVRFADKPKHQVFLEPEGYDNERVYCNGISTSLPKDVQDAIVREIPALRRAKIMQYGYAVEYDFVPTHQTRRCLETKRVAGLFLAGQINGTSGYEEAAGQGLIAGINAVRAIRGDEPFVLGRDEAYIGVMIDDLITRPPTEPYRMFTSRAEYRLRLRSDNADQRLTTLGRQMGTVDDQRWGRFEARQARLGTIASLAQKVQVHGVPLSVWMRRPDAGVPALARALRQVSDTTFATADLEQVMTDARYGGYVERQQKQIERLQRLEGMAIPPNIDYRCMHGLRNEAREKLMHISPASLGQAARISGVNPADITVLWIYLTARRSLERTPPVPGSTRPHEAA